MLVVIIGGKIAGLSVAGFLKRLSISCVVLDSRPDIEKSSLHLGIWSPAIFYLSELGCKLTGHSVVKSGYRSVKGNWLITPRNGLQRIDCGRPSLSFVEESHLVSNLEKLVDEEFIYRSTTVTGISYDTVLQKTIVYSKDLNTGRTKQWPADLVVVADGAFSRLRAHLYPMLNPLEYRGYKVYRGHTSSSGSEMSRHRLSEDAFQTWGPGARFACVPTKDGNAWFAAVTAPQGEKPSSNFRLSDLQKTVFRGWHEPITELLSGTDEGDDGIKVDEAWAFRKCFPAGLSGVFNGSAVAFVGDAGHTLDPILAQGAGVAIEDGARLAVAISQCTDTSGVVNWEAALASYEARRFRRLRPLHQLSNISQALGHLESQALCTARDAVLGLTPSFIKGRVMDEMISYSLSHSR